MKNNFFILSLVLTSFCFPVYASNKAKVTAVIPVKFNGKGLHAPVPYNQKLMATGRVRVPTMNLPFTFSGGSKFNPTAITKRTVANSISNLAKNSNRMHPALKAFALAYGAYELNCVVGNFPALCMDDPSTVTGDPDFAAGGRPPSMQKVYECEGSNVHGETRTFRGRSVAECVGNYASWHNSSHGPARPDGHGGEVTLSVGVKTCSESSCTMELTRTVVHPTFGTQRFYQPFYKGADEKPKIEWCPPETNQEDDKFYTVGPVAAPNTDKNMCWKPVKGSPIPITPEWIEKKIEENPAPLGDIGLDDFNDPQTGSPDPNLFENPTVDNVSPAFREAAEAAARGTLQTSNPNGQGYVPPNLYQDFLINLNNWYEGDTFVDVFTGKDVKPETPPAEATKTDWTDFPGITQGQYEQSNNNWGNNAANKAPDIQKEITTVEKSFQDLKDIIKDEPTEVPFQLNPFELINFPHGGCRGFNLDVTLAGQPKTIIVDQHCPPYESWGRPFVEWILGVFTLLHIFNIARRALEVQ